MGYWVITQIYNEEYFEDVLMLLAEIGVEQSVVADGHNFQHVLSSQVPIFSALRFDLNSKKSYCKVVFSYFEDEQILEQIKTELKELPLKGGEDCDIFYLKVDKIV